MICYCQETPIETDFLDYLPNILAFVALLIAIYVVILTKRADIQLAKFQKLCLDVIEAKFSRLETLIDQNKESEIGEYLQIITDANLDLNLIFIQLKSIYPQINIDVLQDITQEFTDKAYLNYNQKFYTLQSDFLITKIRVQEKLYDYALYHEFSYISRKLYS